MLTKFYKDIIQFWNPGDVFGSDEHLLEPGEKEARNPRIAAAFRRLALCEQAGTGIRMMKSQWQELGHPEPELTNDRSHKAFEFRLGLAIAAMPASIRDQAGTKLGLSQDQVKVLSSCLREQNLVEIMGIVGRKNRTKFRDQVLNPLLKLGFIAMTIPDKPRSSKQKYKLTDKGRQIIKDLSETDEN